jgi:hypothetical protein
MGWWSMDLKTIKIKGQDYVQVSERIRHFRTSENYKGWAIEVEWLRIDEDIAIARAIIRDAEGVAKSMGTAMEKREERKEGEKVKVNETSHVENCETSAIGRALGILGIGIAGGEVASYEEVLRAKKQQIINSINNMIDEKNRDEFDEVDFSLMSLEELEEIEKQLQIQEKNKICKSIVEMCTQEDIGEILKKYRTNNLGNLDLKDLIYLHDRIVTSNQIVTKKDIQDLKKIADTLGNDIEKYVEKNYKKKLEELTKREYKKIKKILNS